jgi:FkbH-like protein
LQGARDGSIPQLYVIHKKSPLNRRASAKVQFTEALKKIREYSSADLPLCQVRLLTGFNPLHLQAFLQAHLQQLLPKSRVLVSTDVYGDLAGALMRLQASLPDMCAIALEWPDLDPRLGFRQLGGWGPGELADVVVGAQERLLAIRKSLESLPGHFQMALSLPTLALPPVFHTPSCQLSESEIHLRKAADELALWAAGRPNMRVVRLPSSPAFDFKGEVMAGLPYAMSHADQLAESFAKVLVPPRLKKGLITDLDDTLWAGIAGEVGPEAVSWDLDNKTQPHGLYQQLLHALADQGVLIGAASRNDPAIVEAVFRRNDIVLPRNRIFPIEANWNAKSESVARILDAWNVHADSVIFVDNSPAELAEVKAAHTAMECIQFDGQNYADVHSLLYRLRDLFARQTITPEDGLRRESVRAGTVFREAEQSPGASHENFLRDAEAKIIFDFTDANPRSLELVNKTNQFNLNGTRFNEKDWHASLAAPNSFTMSASYRDKYGPLGVIAVLAGQSGDKTLTVNTWVMSCRAFGRRIEYQCLKAILDRFSAQELVFEFSPTPRNEYLQEFTERFLGEKPTGRFSISRGLFLDKCPKLYHEVEVSHE